MPKQIKNTTISQSLADAEHRLTLSGIDRNEAKDLLAFVVKKSTGFLLTNGSCRLSAIQEKKFLRLLKKRISGLPFAYCVGTKGFYELEFAVTPSVLIPRPETESLIDWVLKNISKDFDGSITDVGTGSGCIAVTLAKYLPKAKIFAVDVSQAALTVAKKNARTNKVSSRIKFLKGNLLSGIKDTTPIHLIVANLPYLSKEELGNVPFEPIKALYGGKLGLEYIDKLLGQIESKKIKQAILEISPLQQPWLEARYEKNLEYTTEFLKDLSDQVRFIIIKRRT